MFYKRLKEHLTLYFTAIGIYDSMRIRAITNKYLEGKKGGRGGGRNKEEREREKK